MAFRGVSPKSTPSVCQTVPDSAANRDNPIQQESGPEQGPWSGISGEDEQRPAERVQTDRGELPGAALERFDLTSRGRSGAGRQSGQQLPVALRVLVSRSSLVAGSTEFAATASAGTSTPSKLPRSARVVRRAGLGEPSGRSSAPASRNGPAHGAAIDAPRRSGLFQSSTKFRSALVARPAVTVSTGAVATCHSCIVTPREPLDVTARSRAATSRGKPGQSRQRTSSTGQHPCSACPAIPQPAARTDHSCAMALVTMRRSGNAVASAVMARLRVPA